MDATTLRNTRLIQAACVLEFTATISLGLVWLWLGAPAWQGFAVTSLAVVGAVGVVVTLPRVDFSGELLVVAESPARSAAPDPGVPAAAGVKSGTVWAGQVRTRNWEALGDRGGRRILRAERSASSDEAALRVARNLSD
jgi:hypothetical protein